VFDIVQILGRDRLAVFLFDFLTFAARSFWLRPFVRRASEIRVPNVFMNRLRATDRLGRRDNAEVSLAA
jgi:hypothetical protein